MIGIRTAACCLVSFGLLPAQHTIGELVAELATNPDPRSAQVELRWRAQESAAALAHALRVGFDGVPLEAAARGAAARVLTEIGSAGGLAFDELVECVRDQALPADVVDLAAWALIHVSPFAPAAKRRDFAASVMAARRSDVWRPELQRWRTQLLGALSVDGSGASVGELESILLDTDLSRVATACRVLRARATEFAPLRREIATVLAATVEMEFDSSCVLGVAWCHALPSLTDSEARMLRTDAASALLAYAPSHASTLLGHCQRLFDLDPKLRIEAAKTLGARRDADAGHWLVEALRVETDADVAMAMLEATARIGPDLAWLAPALVDACKDHDDRLVRMSRAVARAFDADFEQHARIAPTFEIVELGIDSKEGIDLKTEVACLTAWLDADDGANRRAIQLDPTAIDAFHALASADGGPRDARLRWVPARILPHPFHPGLWIDSLGKRFEGVVVASPRDALGPGRARLRSLPWLIELVPSDRRRPHVTQDDLELRGDRHATTFEYVALRRAEFEDWYLDAALRGGVFARLVGGLTVSFEAPIRGHDTKGHGYLWIDDAASDRLDTVRAMLQR
ncbi:MAG: HEAT repeat domain-containing protein [Planctomycetota bacterium]